MREAFVEFFTFAYPNIKYVVIGSVLLSISSAVVGCFTFLQKKSLIGDVISHSVLPGVCLSFMISGTKDPILIIIGAFITRWLSIVVMDFIVNNSKIKEDTATGLSLSVFFGIGILLLTVIQHSGNAAQTGLDSFLFGNAAALIGTDLLVFGIIAGLILIMVWLLYKELKVLAFNPDFGRSIGLPIRAVEIALSFLTVLAVVTGIQAVGVVLMAAMLITPAATARFWTDRLGIMIFLASLFGALSGISGAFVSYVAPGMPTGPWIVMIVSLMAVISFFIAPKKGIITKLLKQRATKRRLLEENILKTFFAIGEKDEMPFKERSMEELLEKRDFTTNQLQTGLRRLEKQRYIERTKNNWQLLQQGFVQGKRTQRLHRLWELYLTEYLRIAPDHVHEDAESIEHVITPALEIELEKLLNYPDKDPHDSLIPER